MKKLIIVLLGLFPLATVYAQTDSTLSRTVVVENEYNPTIMDASKVNVLPKIDEPTIVKKAVEYATTSRKMIGWTKESMIPIERDLIKKKVTPGYLNVGYGNYGNVLLGTGYLLDITNVDRLEVDFLLNGMNGEIYSPMHGRAGDWGGRWYDTSVKALYNHIFKPVVLNIGGSYMSQVYNYMGIDSVNPLAWVNGNKRQHNTIGDVFVNIASRNKDLPFRYKFQTGFQYFSQKYSTFGLFPIDSGFDIVNEESPNNNPIYGVDKDIEKKIHTVGDVWAGLNEGQNLGIAFGMDNMMYSPLRMPNYTSVLLNPYYTIEGDEYRVRLGVHVDWLSGDDGGVDVAPNIKAEYIFQDSYILYADMDGSRQLNDYRHVNGISRYWQMDEFLKPSYTQIDAKIGFRASPMNGLWFNVYGGYRIVDKDIYGLSTLNSNVPGRGYYTVSFLQGKSKVPYFGADLKYSYKDLFDFGVNGLYQSWKTGGLFGYTDDVLLYYTPKFKLNIYAQGKVYEGLTIEGGLKYIKRYSDQLSDVNDLYVGANYEFFKNISVFGQVHNILNKEYGILGYPQEKLNFLAGFKLYF